MDLHWCSEVCGPGHETQAGTRGGAGSPGRRQESRGQSLGGSGQSSRQPGRLCYRGPWAHRDAFLSLGFQFWDWRFTLTCSISPPGSLMLGCTTELRWGRGAGRDGIPGSVLTSCLVSCPRGAVLHVNGRAECHSGTWGCLQNDRPLQVSPPTPPPSWPQLLLSARSPPLHYLISPLYHSLRWLWLICPFFR